MKKQKPIHAVIDRLADLYEYGHLDAALDPAFLLNRVCDEVEALRAVAEAVNIVVTLLLSYTNRQDWSPVMAREFNRLEELLKALDALRGGKETK